MTSHGRAAALLGAVLLTLPGCSARSDLPTEVMFDLEGGGRLELDLELSTHVTVPSGDFSATVTITNLGADGTTLTSGCAQLARGTARWAPNGEDARFMGAGSGCYTAISTYRIEAGGRWEQTWHVKAATREYLGDFEFDTIPAPTGNYVFRVSPDVISIDGREGRLPELEAPFRVESS